MGDVSVVILDIMRTLRIVIMKKYIAVILCLFLLSLTGCSTQYKRISFADEALGDTYVNENTKIIYTANDSFSEEIPVYKISKRNISNKEFKQMLKQLGLTENESSFELDGNRVSGTLASYTDTSRGYFDMSDEELEELSWDTFNNLPFIEGTYEYLGIKSTDTISSSTETHITRVGVSFRRLIDGVRIIGNELCNLYFDGSGLVEINIELYDYDKIDTIDMISLESASERIKTPDSLSINSEASKQDIAMLETMQVEKVNLLYVNQYRDDCEVLQPIYNFTGVATDVNGRQAKFNSIVIAIPEKYTYTE